MAPTGHERRSPVEIRSLMAAPAPPSLTPRLALAALAPRLALAALAPPEPREQDHRPAGPGALLHPRSATRRVREVADRDVLAVPTGLLADLVDT